MNILHIHQDYPDGRDYPFTKAVSNLIEGCEQVDTSIKHTVLSINRTSNPFKVSVKPFSQGLSVVYWAIPLPIIYYWTMKLSALLMCKHVKDLNLKAIHGHKLTSEGLFAYFLSKKLNIPYVLSIRGGSDMNNIRRLPLHKRLFAKVFNSAKEVFWISAWSKKPLQKALSLDNSKIVETSLLPNICNINLNYPHRSSAERKGYVTAVSYHQHKRKGVAELIEAISLLNKLDTTIELNIYGSGDDVYKTEIENLITKFNATEFVHLKGQVTQSDLLEAMSQSKGFLLPAVNETFGMAYIEALSVGCPILYVENTGIDGYFSDVSVGEKISNLNVDELVSCLEKINKNNTPLCKEIKKLQDEDFLSFYTSPYISQKYISIIKKALHV
jgi:glycosyltransferase involved in cell wall biosynthesis